MLFTYLSKNFREMQQPDHPVDCSCSTKPNSLPPMTVLGTLRKTLPFAHRVCVAGTWLEGLSFSCCERLDLFQTSRNSWQETSSSAIFREDVSDCCPKAAKALSAINGAVFCGLWLLTKTILWRLSAQLPAPFPSQR